MLKKNPRFTAFALLVLTTAIGAGALVFRVLTLHPRTNTVDLGSLQKRLRTAEIPNLHSVIVTTAGLYNSPVQKRVMDVWSAVVDASRQSAPR